MHRAPFRAHLDGDLGMRTQVVKPARMARIPTLRGDDHEVLTVLDIEQRRSPPRAALRAHVVEEQHRGQAGEGVANPAAAEPVDERVAPHQVIHEGPHPLLDAAGDIHAHNHALSAADGEPGIGSTAAASDLGDVHRRPGYSSSVERSLTISSSFETTSGS